MRLLCISNSMNLARRKLSLKPHLDLKYHLLASQRNPVTAQLFGDNLEQKVSDIYKVSQAARNPRFNTMRSHGGDLTQDVIIQDSLAKVHISTRTVFKDTGKLISTNVENLNDPGLVIERVHTKALHLLVVATALTKIISEVAEGTTREIELCSWRKIILFQKRVGKNLQ